MVRNAEPAGATPTLVEPRGHGLHPVRTADVAARVLAWVAGLVAIIGLASWAVGTTADVGFGLYPMVPMTAATIALCSTAIVTGYRSRSPRAVGKVLGTFALLIGLTALAHDAMGIARGTVGFDATFIDEVSPGASGWLAPNTAVSITLIALALLLEPRQAEGHAVRRHLISAAGTTALLLATLTLVGWVYGVDTLRGLPGHLSMSINTAIAIAMLSLAVLLQSTGGGLGDLLRGHDAGAVLARLALPAAIVFPLLLGALKLVSDRAGWFGPTVGTAVRTIVEMMVFAGLALFAIARLRRVDRERERLMDEERHARAAAEEAQAMLEENAEALEEQAQELETTVDDLKSANESLEAQRAIADAARSAEIQSRSLLDAVIDQLPVGVVLARMPSGEVVRRNRVGEEIAAALNRGDGSRSDAVVWHRTDGTPYTRDEYPLNRTVKTAEVIEQEEMTARLSDGSSLHITVSAVPVYAEGIASMAAAVFADVSPRRAAEAALAERDALLASFFRAPAVMISVVEADTSAEALAKPDIDYRFVLMNAQAAAVFGNAERDVMGRMASELGVPVDRRRSLVESLVEARRTEKPAVLERMGLASLNGSAKPERLSIVVSPLADQPGRIPRFCLIATDVSHQHNLEEALRQAQKLEAVGRLAGGVAHDFNNLLTAITGFTRFALSDVPAGSSVHDDLEQALQAAERAAGLTHQLLAFSRQQMLQPQVLDLNQVVSNIEPMLRRVIGEDIAIHRSLTESLGAVRADRGQLEQVLVNLVVNARDAMPDGGLLTIETDNVDLDTAQAAASRGGSTGPHVMLAVTDTGVGMTAETRNRIFEPFFTTKGTGQGTGLGLATVFGIVNQSGGSIWVYSEPGHGTTFKIYLPRYDGPADVARPVTPISVPSMSGRLLVVEDDPAVRSIAARALRRGGYEVVEATTGQEGLATYRSLGGRVDLVLTDLVLPEMGGRAMAQALIAEGLTAPVVYMSGYTAEAVSAQSVLEAGDQFVEKPFTPESLLAKVREAMQIAAEEPRRAG